MYDDGILSATALPTRPATRSASGANVRLVLAQKDRPAAEGERDRFRKFEDRHQIRGDLGDVD